MGARRLYALIKNLPSDAALFRVQQLDVEENGTTLRTNDPDEIQAFFNEHIG